MVCGKLLLRSEKEAQVRIAGMYRILCKNASVRFELGRKQNGGLSMSLGAP